MIDIVDDKELTLLRPVYEKLPEFIKSAQVEFSDEHVPDSAFALVIIHELDKEATRKFRTDTISNTWLSAYYFSANSENLSKQASITAATNIKRSMKKYGLEVPEKVAALAEIKETGNRVYECTVPTVEKVEPSNKQKADQLEAAFEKTCSCYTPEKRHEIAVKIASMPGAEIKDGTNIAKYASTEISDMFVDNIMTRKWNVPVAHLRSVIEKSATVAPEIIAKVIEKIDEEFGVDDFYDAGIPDPFETVFQKTACTTTNATEKLEALSKSAALKNYFERDVVERFAEDPAKVFEEMPAVQKAVLARISEHE